MRIAKIQIRVDSQGAGDEKNPREERHFEEVRFELGTEYWQRRRVSGIRRDRVHSRVGPMTEKALLAIVMIGPHIYGMKRTSESEDRVETECD